MLFFTEKSDVLDELDEQIWKRTRVYMYTTAALVAVWGVFDAFIDFKNLWVFLLLRATYTPITLLWAFCFHLSVFRKHHKQWALAHYLLLIADIGIMVLWTDSFVKYLIGFSTIFWGASVIMLWRFWNTVIPGLAVIVIASLRFYFFPHDVAPGEFITGFYYFTTCLVFTSVISAYGYWSAYLLAEKNIILKNTQQRLVQAEKMHIASVAHEINTPIGTAITATSHAQEQFQAIIDNLQLGEVTIDQLSDPAADGVISITSALNELHRTAHLVEKFKEAAVDQSSYERRKFNLPQYIQDNIIQVGLRPILKRSNIAIELGGEKDIVIDSYPGEFSQIFTNLIMNSIAHGYTDGELVDKVGNIRIHITRDVNGVTHIRYQDDGKGISGEILAKVFDPFFTTKGTEISHEGRGQSGSGLGMSIVYNIVTQKLKGRIEAFSRPGLGALFTIEVPGL